MNLFDPLPLRGVTLRNRIGVSPMCEYSAIDGVPQAWHLVHLGSRAVGGAGLVIAEASAVEPRGRISPGDTGLWNDAQAEAWAPIARFVRGQGAIAGIQLAHAGRKAGVDVPWRGGAVLDAASGGWQPLAPSALAYSPQQAPPAVLDEAGIRAVVDAFAASARRALDAGFDLVEVHAAHGYLLHEFLSPLANRRDDAWGGCFENRIRLTRDVVAAVRAVWPERLPLFVRISATDWVDGGWDVDQSVELARVLKGQGVDLVDVSSGGLVADQRISAGPGYQVPFAARIRAGAGIATAAVGLVTEAAQAQAIVAAGHADLVLAGREFLRDPYWPRRVARELGVEIAVPDPYRRAW
ncbi:MAG: NADH:flavin oxidoreductase/NADH oxidase [Xanthomonadales bacterium]|nr:NADH:flavin oxidoreductase/NADH oxidase [Xanthomonadales bacterium]